MIEDDSAEDVFYDTEIRENLKKLYSNMIKEIEPLTYDAFKDKFSMEDDFVIMRQKSEDVLKEESFDEDGNLADLMLGEDASYHINKHMASLKMVGPPRRVKIPSINSRNSFIGEQPVVTGKQDNNEEENTLIKYDNLSFNQSNKKVIRNPFAMENKDEFNADHSGVNLNLEGTLEFRSKDVMKTTTREQERKKRWSKEISDMKEKSKEIVDKLFKSSNLMLNDDLDRPLPYHERFNSGDAAYVPSINPDEMTLMDKLIQYAKQNSSDAKSSNHALPTESLNNKIPPKNKYAAKLKKEQDKPKIIKFFSKESSESSNESDELTEDNDAWFRIRREIYPRKERRN